MRLLVLLLCIASTHYYELSTTSLADSKLTM